MPRINLERNKAREAGETTFHGAPCLHGHGTLRETSSGKCLVCVRERAKRTYHQKNEYYREQKRKQAQKDKERISEWHKGWYQKNKNKKNKQSRDNYLKNRDNVLKRQSEYRKENKHKVAKLAYDYKAKKAKASPPWLTDEDNKVIESIYEMSQRLSNCLKIKHEVDHIVPIKGKTVCGLHVPWNLRVIPEVINRRKGNKLGDHDVNVP